jgi:hypothetical protein
MYDLGSRARSHIVTDGRLNQVKKIVIVIDFSEFIRMFLAARIVFLGI